MIDNKLIDHCSLVVSSCDKYETVWYPYFELIKKYWRDHPNEIYLITESKTYTHKGLNITCINTKSKSTWSERLFNCLTKITSKYIIFSLEDFFLLDNVKSDQLEKCFHWMEDNPGIAVCRLAVSCNKDLKHTLQYDGYCIAGKDIGYRLDTQFALWNREALINFLDLSESPWEFEEYGTVRIKDTDKIFLWFYTDDDYSICNMVFPYRINQLYGFGIAWGKWLWNNKKWFVENGINKVNYKKLGVLKEKHVKRRIKYLYNQNPDTLCKIIKYIYRCVVYTEKVAQNIRIQGIIIGIKASLSEFAQAMKRKYTHRSNKY
jgi:hypothetical protein